MFDTDITAVKLSFATLPSDIIHLQPFTVVVNAVDASGTLDADFQSTINLAISSGTLSTTVATAILGAATFSGITVNGAGSNRTLEATTPINLTSATSSPFSIGKAQATVTFPTLEATFDGTPKSAAATTVPANLPVSFSYELEGMPLTGPPAGPGVFGVTATVNDVNYVGSATGGMTIHGPAAPAATLTVSPSSGNPPLSVTYTVSATGYSSSAFLETGDDGGKISDNTYANTTSFGTTVQATYSTPGTHTAVLTVRGPGGSSQVQTTVTVNAPPTLSAIDDASTFEDQQIELDLTGIDAGAGTWSVSGR